MPDAIAILGEPQHHRRGARPMKQGVDRQRRSATTGLSANGSTLLPILKGLAVTLRHFLRNLFGQQDVATIQYPEEVGSTPSACAAATS